MKNFLNYLTKYNPDIEKIFSKSLKHSLNVLYDISLEKEKKIYLVGGIVRDIFLGRNSADIDIVLEGDCQEFAACVIPKFPVSKHRFTERFMTYNIFTKTGTNIDIASFREERYEYPGALPSVIPSSIENDYRRRDFSINAMYISFDDKTELYDPLNAINDLKNKIIRIIHDKSFEDDPTRIFRAVKFAARYNFSFDENTEKLLLEAVEKNYLSTISNMRIKNEFYMLLSEKKFKTILKLFRDYKIFKFLNIPNPSDEDIEEVCKITEKTIFKKMRFEHKVSKSNFILMYFLRNLSYEEKLKALTVFEMSEKALSNFTFKDEELEDIRKKLNKAQKKSEIYRCLNKLSPFKVLYFFYTVGENKTKIKSYIFDLMEKRPFIKGADLIKAGFSQDETLGKYIELAFNIQLDTKETDKESIILQLKKLKEINVGGGDE